MCLDTLKELPRKIRYAYKEVRKEKNKRGETVYAPTIYREGKVFRMGRWTEDFYSNRNEFICSAYTRKPTYPKGFHCYTNKRYLRNEYCCWIKVEIDDIVAYGTQDTYVGKHNVVVARKIKPVEEIA